MTPEERRRTQVAEIKRRCITDLTSRSADWALGALLAHFDEQEPAVADAIRYGLTSFESLRDGERGPLILCDRQAFFIDYPHDSTAVRFVGAPPENSAERESARKPTDSTSTEVLG